MNFCKFTAYSSGEITWIQRLKKCQDEAWLGGSFREVKRCKIEGARGVFGVIEELSDFNPLKLHRFPPMIIP